MPRNLSAKQLKFAAAVAAGKTQAAAYAEAGYSANGKPVTASRHARQLAQKAEVRASIEKMRRQLLPDPGDVRDIRTHAMAVIVGLSLNAGEEKVRLAAATWLHEEAGKQIAEREALEAGRGAQGANSPEVIMAELRALYAKALPGREPPLVVEVHDAPGEE